MSVNPRLGACTLWLMHSFRGGANDIHRPVLYAVYGSDIMVRLRRIHAHPERDGPDGWLVVAFRGRRPAYVRCHFADDETLLCEAAIGNYPVEAMETASISSVATEEGLKKSGYWRDGSGRALFKYEITHDSGVWAGASVVILDPLISVFGARATSKIKIIAPLAPERDEAAIQRELRQQ